MLTHLHAADEVGHHSAAGCFVNGFHLCLDVSFQLTNSLRVCFVDPILQVAPQEKIGGAEIRTVWGPFEVSLSTDDSVVEVCFQPVKGQFGGVGRCTILLEVKFCSH